MIIQPYDLQIINGAFKSFETAALSDAVHDFRAVIVNPSHGYVIGEIRYDDGFLVIDLANYSSNAYSIGEYHFISH